VTRRPALVDTRVIYCGDCLDKLRTLPNACVDLIYIDPPFNSNRNYEVFWGEGREKRAFPIEGLDDGARRNSCPDGERPVRGLLAVDD
jgi:hypothetical protein